MSDIDIVIKSSRRLESMLSDGLGAEGRGLHQKISSVEDQLPESLVRRLRFVATMRNKVVHEDVRLDDRRGFINAGKRGEKELQKLIKARKSRCFVATAVFVRESHPALGRLRSYRDEVLRRRRSGRLFVWAYELVGPWLALVVCRWPRLRGLFRRWLLGFCWARREESRQ